MSKSALNQKLYKNDLFYDLVEYNFLKFYKCLWLVFQKGLVLGAYFDGDKDSNNVKFTPAAQKFDEEQNGKLNRLINM